MATTARRALHLTATTTLLLLAQAVVSPGRAAADPPKTVAPASPAASTAKPPAPNASPAARAAQWARSGEAKFAAEDYAGAQVDFTNAELAEPAAWHQWYLGHSEDHLGHYRAALAAYEKLVAASPASLGKVAKNLPEASERIAAIKAMPGEIHVEATPASAVLTVDGAEQTGASPFDLKLPPGSHSLRLSAPGFEAETVDIDVAYAVSRTLSLSLHEVPPPPLPPPPPAPPVDVAPPPPPPPAWPVPRRTLGWAAGGLAIVSAGFGTAFGIVALQSNSSFKDVPTLGRAYRAQDFAVYSDVSFGAAVALGATSLVLLLGGGSPDATAAQAPAPAPAASAARTSAWTLQATPITLPHGGGAGAVVHF
jgi:hypothetical protein